ncbi:YveK family protein [[Clostridium] fimetarium]|uniref:Capsular polysaccharide biosynthesis protein n=1 Tax=[Clostridium] fimetarium TaxID=99656 RepID=A0A1I0RLM5_9FIRM|nr:Wzz/FepE/Etk N-terminal domain-containing protein [[Clostridium] fimetarium]SEW41919.1 Capsular polysaccharide biosynthesis protein [[Clostridium] fimetarium]
METRKQNEEIEIDLKQIMGVLLQKAIIIIITGVIVAVSVFLISKLFISPVYESTTKLYVINRQSEGTTTYNDLASSTQLTKDYLVLIKGRAVTEQVISELNLDTTADALAGSITVNTPTDTRILEIAVRNKDQYQAKEIADKVAKISSDTICKVMQIEQVNIVEEANIPTTPVSSSASKNAMIGGILGILLACAVVIIRFLMNDTIRSAEDIEKYLGISTLALIPISDELNDGEGKKKKKKKRSSSSNNARKQVKDSGSN